MARSMWKGNICLGLLIYLLVFILLLKKTNIPLTNFVQTNTELNKKMCPVEDREVPYTEIKKGYEVEKDNYVIIEKEDLDKIKNKDDAEYRH